MYTLEDINYLLDEKIEFPKARFVFFGFCISRFTAIIVDMVILLEIHKLKTHPLLSVT